MTLLYNIGIVLFGIGVKLVSPVNLKASQLLKGRKETWGKLKNFTKSGKIVWIHCASLGEFEQGRTLIEKLREEKPEYKIVLSFFSPSGYEVRKNYQLADIVVYLPSDTSGNAKKFIDAINPSIVFFVKYEFWYHYFRVLKRKNIPFYSISAIFRDEQIFFKSYGSWWLKMLKMVTAFYVQDEKSGELLSKSGIKNYIVAGDTRFDRVKAIAETASDNEVANGFADTGYVIVAGSTWPPDEDILAEFINKSHENVKMIIAPHEVNELHINQLIKKFKVPVVRFSEVPGKNLASFRVLIIDSIGLLSVLYRYGSIAYIGGGFGKGIHNTLEAATYGLPVIFGPNHKKFKEAVDLIKMGGGFCIETIEGFNQLIYSFWYSGSSESLEKAGEASGRYVKSMCGATPLIMKHLFQNC